jgi:hypothetical protein
LLRRVGAAGRRWVLRARRLGWWWDGVITECSVGRILGHGVETERSDGRSGARGVSRRVPFTKTHSLQPRYLDFSFATPIFNNDWDFRNAMERRRDTRETATHSYVTLVK